MSGIYNMTSRTLSDLDRAYRRQRHSWEVEALLAAMSRATGGSDE